MVEAGQKRLIELQQPDGGWGWNGNGQTHEMMTPYALFGLIQAEEAGYPCPNPNTIPTWHGATEAVPRQHGGCDWRHRCWSIRTRPNSRVRSTTPCSACGSYDAKADELLRLVKSVIGGRGSRRRSARRCMSDYGHALALELAVKHKKKDLADKLAAELRKRAKKSGDHVYWTTAGFSHWGDNTTEITAMVMKALVAHDPNDPLIPGVLAYFHATKRGDRWDSTKDTACVLYALCDYLAAVRAGPAASGLVKVSVNGAAGGEVKLDGPASKVVKLNGKTVKPGENVFKISGANATGGAGPGGGVVLARQNRLYSRLASMA